MNKCKLTLPLGNESSWFGIFFSQTIDKSYLSVLLILCLVLPLRAQHNHGHDVMSYSNSHSRTVALDMSKTVSQLFLAPPEASGLAKQNKVYIDLPLPEGKIVTVRIEETQLMTEALQAQFPTIKTYAFVDEDNPKIYGRLTFSSSGIFGAIFTPNGLAVIEPEDRTNATGLYKVAYGDFDEVLPEDFSFQECHSTNESAHHKHSEKEGAFATNLKNSNLDLDFTRGSDRRIFEIAIVSTGEFFEFNNVGGGGIGEVATVIMNTMNVVNGIYERGIGYPARYLWYGDL